MAEHLRRDEDVRSATHDAGGRATQRVEAHWRQPAALEQLAEAAVDVAGHEWLARRRGEHQVASLAGAYPPRASHFPLVALALLVGSQHLHDRRRQLQRALAGPRLHGSYVQLAIHVL